MRLCVFSIKQINIMKAPSTIKNKMRANHEYTPVLDKSKICATLDGRDETIPTKMMSEMPLPMPEVVILSPNHINITVPPTRLTQVVYKNMLESEMKAPPCALDKA